MGLSLRPLGRKIVDIFSADTQEDQRKRVESGQARYYADQQRAQGNTAPATNPALQARNIAVGIGRGAARIPETAGRSFLQAGPAGDINRMIQQKRSEIESIASTIPDPTAQANINAELSRVDPNFRFDSATPTDPIRRTLYGPEPIETYQTRREGYEKTLEGSRFRDLAGPLSALGGVGMAVSDLVPVGPGKVLKVVKKAGGSKLPKVAAVTPTPVSKVLPEVAPALPSVGKTQRGFVTSVKQSPEVSTGTKAATQGTYSVRSTKALQDQAEKFASGGLKKAKSDLNTRLNVPEGRITDREVADTIALAKRLDGKGSFEDASNLYEKLAAHLTKQGQSVQAASLLARRTPEGLRYHAQKLLKRSGVELNEGQQKQLQGLVEKVRKTKPDTEARDRAVYDVTKYVNDRIPSSAGDKIVNLWRAGLLTAPTTTAGNILGNTGEAIVRKGFVNPVATAADAAMSVFTGKRTQTLASPGSAAEGFVKGAKTLPDYLRTGYDPRNLGKKYEQTRPLNYGDGPLGKALGGYVNGVYRLMGTADAPFSVAAEREALSSIAGAEAINRGLKGKAKADFIKDFMDNPTDTALSRARQEADFATFKNPTVLGKAAVGLKRPLGPVGDFVVPFTQVPAAIATRLVQRTPVGIATEIVKQIRAVKAGQAFDQRAMAQAIGNGTFGVVAIGAGLALAKDNLLTFGYPTDTKERKLWEAEGKQPYSVRIGDRWYSLNYLQPFGMLLAIGGQAQEDISGGKNPTEVMTKALATAGQAIQEQSFLKGINGVLSAVSDPERGAQKWMENTTSSVVPNFIRSGARAADEVQRKPETIVEGVKSGIPGLRGQVPTKDDLFGEPLPAKDNFLNQYANPLRPSIARDVDPLTAEIRRLQDVDLAKIPSQIRKDSFGKDVTLTGEQVKELQTNVGAGVKQAWSQVVETPEYAGLPDEQKSKVLDRISRDVLAVEKYKYAELKGLELPEDLTAKQSAIMDGIFDPSSYTAPPKPKVSQKKTRKKVTARKASGARRSVAKGSSRFAGSPFKYAVSQAAGIAAASQKVSLRKPQRPEVRSKLVSAAGRTKPKVSLKKSRV